MLKKGDVLVDDQERHRHLWEEMGGIFIRHRNARQSLAELAAYFPMEDHGLNRFASALPVAPCSGRHSFMKKPILALAAALFVIPAAGRPQSRVPAAPASLRALADEVSEERLRATVERLVAFGTRHTLSARDDPTRGIGAALNWTESEFRRYSSECGNCLEIARPSDTVTNARIPQSDPGRGRHRHPTRYHRA
jgi:hypothetical protein